MFRKILSLTIALAAASGPAMAEDWTGQTPPPGVVGSGGPIDPPVILQNQLVAECFPSSTPPPCAPGETLGYGGGSGSTLPSIPANASSTTYIFAHGPYSDPSSPSGVSFVEIPIALGAFARSATVDALGVTVSNLSSAVGGLSATTGSLSASFSALQGQMQSLNITFNQFQQQVAMEDRDLRQGIAMSLAMDGTSSLGTDETFAISMNVGTFGGQSGMAAGFAWRAAQHVTLNAGVGTGFNGGLVGGRAGVRMAW